MPFVFGRFVQPLPANFRWQHPPRNVVLEGDCVERMAELPDSCVDFVLTDPPYLVGYRDRSGRTIANDSDDQWLGPAFAEAYRLLKPDSFCVSFYGWNRADLFLAAWRAAGFRPISHLVFQKNYASNVGFLRHQHEQAYLLAKGRPSMAARPIPDVLGWRYTGNRLHPTQKPVAPLLSLIEAFTQPGDLVLDPFCGSGSTRLQRSSVDATIWASRLTRPITEPRRAGLLRAALNSAALPRSIRRLCASRRTAST